jgi:putative transposase
MAKLEGSRGLGEVIAIDEAKVEAHLRERVCGSVEATLNSLLDAEAERLCNARRYERTEGRRDTRAGHYERSLHTNAGQVALKVPTLRHLPLETAIIERYCRRESSVEEALVEFAGRVVGAAGRRHHRGTVGHPGQSLDGE